MKKYFIVFGLLFLTTLPARAAEEVALFAGGCFWCMEGPFEKLDGVKEVLSGYTGGTADKPTYGNYGDSGHTEAVQIKYDPTKVTYDRLLDVLWHSMDPTDVDGQFVDRGKQYRPGIYYNSEAQKKMAEASKLALAKSGKFPKPIVIEIVAAGKFWPAEEYHQHYYKKNPVRYHYYRYRSGRDQFLDSIWKNPTK